VLAHGVEIGQYAAAIREKLLAFSGQHDAPPHVVEQPQAQFLLKIADLSRQRRLSDAQPHRSFRYAAQFSDCNEGSQASRIHRSIVCPVGMEFQHNYALDGSPLEGQSRANELATPAHALWRLRSAERRARRSFAASYRDVFAMAAKGGPSWRTARTAGTRRPGRASPLDPASPVARSSASPGLSGLQRLSQWSGWPVHGRP
jgi:hypothetical protein